MVRVPEFLNSVRVPELPESYWSVFRIHELGLTTAVSPMGRSVSDSHVELLKELGVQHITVLFDGDKPGHEGSETAVAKLARTFYVRAPAVPDDFKPHSAEETVLNKLVVC